MNDEKIEYLKHRQLHPDRPKAKQLSVDDLMRIITQATDPKAEWDMLGPIRPYGFSGSECFCISATGHVSEEVEKQVSALLAKEGWWFVDCSEQYPAEYLSYPGCTRIKLVMRDKT